MSDQRVQVLTAIFAADAVGYSRAMSMDEARAVQALAASRRVIDAAISRFGGQIFNTAGDSVLASFETPASAVACAEAIQKTLAGGDVDPCLVYRIGVHFGQAIENNGDLLGDVVNIAARLEAMAPAGGICVSHEVHEALPTGSDLHWQDLGLRHLKNIVRPVRVHRVALQGFGEPAPTVAKARLPMVLVLPFQSIGDTEDYLAEGLTEDIVTGLSRFSRLAVLGMATSDAYRDGANVLARAAAELGVNFAVRGSIRSHSGSLRLSVQLLDARTGLTLWAERYERPIEALFATQDEVAATIVATLAGVVEIEGADDVARKRSENMEAYDFLLRGMHHARALDAASAREALSMFDKALALDSQFALALAWQALMRLRLWAIGDGPGDEVALLEPARRALALDPSESWCHLVYGQILMYRRRFPEAEEHHRRAWELNPYDANIAALRAPLAVYSGDPVEGERWGRLAMTLNPRYPDWYPTNLGLALYLQRRFAEAIAAYARVPDPQAGVLVGLSASLAMAGDRSGARETADRLRVKLPGFSARRFVDARPFVRDEDRALLWEGLVEAGLAP
ncbi:MAG: adenylate/guanylate cyclase domain-containing protein [Alsobacter sp.]